MIGCDRKSHYFYLQHLPTLPIKLFAGVWVPAVCFAWMQAMFI